MKKKMLAWLLALAMVFTSMPMTADATDVDPNSVVTEDDTNVEEQSEVSKEDSEGAEEIDAQNEDSEDVEEEIDALNDGEQETGDGSDTGDVSPISGPITEDMVWESGASVNDVTISGDVTITVKGAVTIAGTIRLSPGTISNVVFEGENEAKLIRGGDFTGQMFYAEGTSGKFQNLTFNNITLDGGAVWTGDVDKTLKRGTINEGVKATGSVLYLVYANAVMNNSTLQNHDDSTGEKANAVFLRYYSTIDFKDSVVRDNNSISTYYRGGVVTVRQGGTVKTDNTDVYGNSGPAGGFFGISSTGSFGGVAEVKNSKFHNNYSDNGAVFLMQCNSKRGYLSVDGCEFYENASKTAVLTEWAYSRPFIIKDSYFHDNECAVWDCHTDPVLDISGKLVVEEDADYTKYLFETPLVLSGALAEDSSIAMSEASIKKLMEQKNVQKPYIATGTEDYEITKADLEKFEVAEGYKLVLADTDGNGIKDIVAVKTESDVQYVKVTLVDDFEGSNKAERQEMPVVLDEDGKSLIKCLPVCNFEHEGYTFLGWSTEEGNTDTLIDETHIYTKKEYLYAQWVRYEAEFNNIPYSTLKEAVEAANESKTDATVTLLQDVTLGEKLTISGNVTISGEHTITRDDAYTDTLFAVNAGASLTLDGGLVVDGANEYVFDKEAYDADLADWENAVPSADSAKWFTLEEDAPAATAYMITTSGKVNLNDVAIKNHYSTNGSGIVSASKGANVTLTGAQITHCASTAGSGLVVNASAGVWSREEELITVTMNEGTVIDGNHVGGNHGIFKIYMGTYFTMNGGEIKNTTGWNSNGVAIGIYHAVVTMNGGTICSNSSVYGPNNGRNAAIYGHSNHLFTMNGGTVCHNTGRSKAGIDSPYSETGYTGLTTINGGSVLDNTAIGPWNEPDVSGGATLAITGGTFTQDVTKYLAPDLGLVEKDGKYVTTDDLYEYNGTAYKSMAEVIDATKATPVTTDGEVTVPVVKVLTSHKVDDSMVINTDLVIDLNGNTITGAAKDDVQVYPVIRVQDDANVTVKGEGGITNADYVFVLGASDGSSAGNLTIESGKYHGDTTVASVTKGELTITGGEFSVEPYIESEDAEGNYNFLLNCIDANYKDGSAKIVVKGGTFQKFNPADNAAEGVGTNFVAEGYLSEADGDYYTVRISKDKLDPIVTITFDDNNTGTEKILKYPSERYDTIQKLIGTNDYADFVLGASESELLAYIADGRATNIVITLHDDIELSAPINLYNKYYQDAVGEYNVTLEGNGHTITYADGYTGTLFNVEAGVGLTTKHLTIDGGNKFEFYNDTTTVEDGQNWYTRFVNVGDEDKAVKADVFVNAGNLTLGEGTTIQNITIATDHSDGKTENTETGGYYLKYNQDLAIIKSNGGTITMNGAEITGNAGLILNAINVATKINNTIINGNMGAGNKGGIIIADKGTMLLDKETKIVDNKAMARSATVLGVINGAEVTSEATIERNKHLGVGSNTAGAIVVLEGASQFVMNGGSISNNVGGRAGAIASRWVGGNYGQHKDTSIVLNTGIITGNTASNDSWSGASVFLRSPATIGEGMKIDGTIVVNATPGELDITGGTFEGSLVVTNGLKAEITGGTFDYNPTEWCAKGYAPVDNGDGTWTVKPNMIFQMHLTDANGEAHWLSPMSSNDLASIIRSSKIWYDTLQGTYNFTLTVSGNYEVDETVVVNFPLTIDLCGNIITASDKVENSPVFRVLSDVTIKNGTVDGRLGSSSYAFIVGNNETKGNLTIEDGEYYGDTSAVSVTKGKLLVKGGEFAVTPYEGNNYDFLLNCIDTNYNSNDAVIEVTGGTFHNFDPANNAAEGKETNFVAKDYKSTTVDGGETYTVVEREYVAQVGEFKYEDLKAAIEACTNGETVKLIADITYDADDVVYAHGGATGFGKYDASNPSIIYIGGTKGATAAENQPSNVNAVIDLNGHTITNNADAYLFLIMDNAKVTFTDSSEDNSGSVVGETEWPVLWVTGAETLVTINDGTYTTANDEGLIWSTHSGDLVISGGEFKTTAEDASLLIMLNTKVFNNPNYFLSGIATVTVNGGTFCGFNPKNTQDDNTVPFTNTNVVAEGYGVNETVDEEGNSRFGVVKAVVEMDGKYYPTIKDALGTLKSADTSVHNVKVLQDHEIDVNYSTFNYPILVNGFSVVLDLNGKTITADWTKYTGSRADNALIGICNGGKLTVTDSVGGGKIVNNDTKENVENRIFWIMNGTATKELILNIEGATFVQNDINTALLYIQGNGKDSTDQPVTVNIKGGHFESVNEDLFNAYDGSKYTAWITGGTYNQDPTDNEIKIHEDYKVVENEEAGIWTVEQKVVAWNVNTNAKYLDVTDALNEAGKDETIKLMCEYEETDVVVVPADVTFDLNGKYLTPKNLLSFGDVIDTAEVVGGIKISNDTTKAIVQLQPENGGYLPIYDTTHEEGCYRFFEYEVKISTNRKATNVYNYIYAMKLNFSNKEAYNVLANTAESGLTVVANIDWTGLFAPIRYVFEDSLISQYGKIVYPLESNSENLGFTLYGLDKLENGDSATIQMQIESMCGVTYLAKAYSKEVVK